MGRTHDEDRFEKMTLSFHERLRDGFLDIARKNPDRCVLIDATRSVDAIQKELRETVAARLLP